jgi:hypothetical protein
MFVWSPECWPGSVLPRCVLRGAVAGVRSCSALLSSGALTRAITFGNSRFVFAHTCTCKAFVPEKKKKKGLPCHRPPARWAWAKHAPNPCCHFPSNAERPQRRPLCRPPAPRGPGEGCRCCRARPRAPWDSRARRLCSRPGTPPDDRCSAPARPESPRGHRQCCSSRRPGTPRGEGSRRAIAAYGPGRACRRCCRCCDTGTPRGLPRG